MNINIITIVSLLILSTSNGISQYFMNNSYYQAIIEQDDIQRINADLLYIYEDFIDNPIMKKLDISNKYIHHIEKNAFRKLPNLITLILSHNEFNTSKILSFGGHEKLQVLFLYNATGTHEGSKVLISGYFPNLEILSLGKNSAGDLELAEDISKSLELHEEKSPFPKLKHIDLSENVIYLYGFMDLLPSNLLSLNLRSNALPCITLDKKLKNLIILNLDNNNVQYLYNDMDSPYPFCTVKLHGLKNLRYLSISQNKIKMIDSLAFKDNINLRYLNLSSNKLQSLRSDIFVKLKFLKVLDLSFNELNDIPHVTSNLNNLIFLSLNNNNITKIISNVFAYTELRQLFLKKNQIDEIDTDAFAQLSCLKDLDLSYNMLRFLPKQWARSLKSLKYLDLSNNKFTSLDSLSLTNTLPLIEVYLATNLFEYLNVKDLEIIPQNATINLIQESNFIHEFDIETDTEDYCK